MNKNKISDLANDYIKTKNQDSLKGLLEESEYLVKHMMHNYKFPIVDEEDIRQECLSIVLLKSLKNYRKKKAKFSTYYHWQLKSFLANKSKYYNRDKRKAKEIPLDMPVGKDGNGILYLRDFIVKINGRVKILCRKSTRLGKFI